MKIQLLYYTLQFVKHLCKRLNLLELFSIVYQCYAIKKRLKFIRSLYKD